MARTIFNFHLCNNQGEKKTIQEVASNVWIFLSHLKHIDSANNKFFFIDKKNKKNFLSILEIEKGIEVLALADRLLQYHKYDIRNHNNVDEPTVNFSREEGFMFSIVWEKNGQEVLSFQMVRGRWNLVNFTGSQSVSYKFETTSDWYIYTFKKLISYAKPFKATLSFWNNIFITKNERPVILNPGWVTYFSYECGLSVPQDFTDIEIERDEFGTYLIATREDITQSKEYYEMIKARVIHLKNELIEKVPGYLMLDNNA